MFTNKPIITCALVAGLSLVSPVSPAQEDTDSLEPEVVITQDERGLIEEFRSNGKLYMIKITPKKGPVYYLVDGDGDGELESRKNELAPNLLIPSWVLFSW